VWPIKLQSYFNINKGYRGNFAGTVILRLHIIMYKLHNNTSVKT